MDETRSRERRIGARQKVHGKVRWRTLRGASWFARVRRRDWRTVIVDDLSLTGARVIAEVEPAVRVGTAVELEADGHVGTARIRWIEPQPDGHTAHVGVEFLELSPGLQERVEALVADGRPETVDWRWLVAR